jgi:threonine/homoserine/homoserine lactone efflux protein
MIGLPDFLLFLAAATVIAVTPGPGILYVAARSLSGGRAEGIASSLGTGIGGCAHIAAGALGVSALVLASAEAFTALKLLGAAYLLWLGVRTMRDARQPLDLALPVRAAGAGRALREGIVVEALNPKTAAFFLAFLPQFVDPAAGRVGWQFVLLGLVSVGLNTGVDVLVAFAAASVRARAAGRAGLVRRMRQASGGLLMALGLGLLLARRPAG